jgi:sulfopropanediol 3-dehydrogenase
MEYLKQAKAAAREGDPAVAERVRDILRTIRSDGESAVRQYAKDLDNWSGEFYLSAEKRAALISQVPEQTKQDLHFAWQQIRRFAEAQRASLTEFEIETEPGVTLGQRLVPVQIVGCYVPGGRYAHAASALMSIATAKVAGVSTIIACSPPRNGNINAAVVYAMDLASADIILEMGGVHAIAAMAFGLFGNPPADMIVGPGNSYVAAAKKMLFGEVGIDVVAGPTESAIIADALADPSGIAIDLISQAEHGPDSPVWLITDNRELGQRVIELVPNIAAGMPNADTINKAWEDHGDVVLCADREEMVRISDRYAPEHLQIMADDHDWWLSNLVNYGSLFLGEGSTVTHGDKCSGTNHILPTLGGARYTGGLNVQKFIKVLTWQKIDEHANRAMSSAGSRISRVEGMEGHARACDWRLRKYFPDEDWPFTVGAIEQLENRQS